MNWVPLALVAATAFALVIVERPWYSNRDSGRPIRIGGLAHFIGAPTSGGGG